ncbi:MAG: glycosyltransferase [Candidatus Zixiibacteriota bacterium]
MRKQIKILQISESSETGGAETVLLNIVENLDKAKYHSIVVLLKTGWLNQKLEESGFSPILLTSVRSYDISLLVRLWLNVKKHDIDIIHSHLPDVNAYSCLAGFAARVPVVTTYHGMIAGSQEQTRSDKLKFFLVRSLSTRIVAVSDALKNELVQLAQFPPRKLTTIYNGVHWERFDRPIDAVSKRIKLGIGPEDKVIGIVANLKATKGYQYFIRAAAIISKNITKVKFLIIGEEEERLKATIVEEIKAIGLEDRVVFLGFREDVPELLRILDVFVLSSISEGMSIATVEAMGAGVPVVVTKSGGPQELVEDGKTGFLVPPKDENSLAEKVLLLLKDKELATSMGKEAQAQARTRFSIDMMIRDYQAVYQECLRKGERQV